MMVTAVVLAILAAVIDHLWGIAEPWRKLIYAGLVIVFLLGLLAFLGLIPRLGPWP